MRRYHYIDKELPVYQEVPAEGIEVNSQGHIKDWAKLKERPELLDKTFYYCRNCKGYIEGKPSEERINTIGPLAGRCGRSYHCQRCAWELSFTGYMS